MKSEPDVIWKYELEVTDHQTIETPKFWNPLKVDYLNPDTLCIWAEVEQAGDMVERTIAIYGTGRLLPGKHWQWVHIGTVLDHGSIPGDIVMVWHVYWKLLGQDDA